jgi:HipA-like kinase
MLRTTTAIRYVTPLREGGSLPAIVECDDGALRVIKFRGAGQGPRALVAEVIAGLLGARLGLNVPELVAVELDPVLGKAEPDPDIRDLLVASAGQNLGMAYLAGAIGFDAAARERVPADLAAAVVCFDAYVTNVDRTARNPNLLWWHGDLWLIDHGAALYAHHADGFVARAASPFAPVRDHVLLPAASDLTAAGAALIAAVHDELLAEIVAAVPPAWLDGGPPAPDYIAYLRARRDSAAVFLEEAGRARASLV